MTDLQFYQNKKVLVTGHTGFKGTWLCRILIQIGADLVGYSLPPQSDFFALSEVENQMCSIIGDIRDLDHLKSVFREHQPQVVFHLAAQPIVRVSYDEPVQTYETNVMGTVNLLECVRLFPCVESVLNITTDKVYENKEWSRGYVETDNLNGHDPYSNSKSCSELVTHSYIQSFFTEKNAPVISTARAGNVIGGGDDAKDRIIPDCVRAWKNGSTVTIRRPHSVRPFQHVLEPLFAYLTIARRQCEDRSLAGNYNVGPRDEDCIETGRLTELFAAATREDPTDLLPNALQWEIRDIGGPPEANFLKLNCTKIREIFGYQPRWDIQRAVAETVAWTRVRLSGGDIPREMDREIETFLATKSCER